MFVGWAYIEYIISGRCVKSEFFLYNYEGIINATNICDMTTSTTLAATRQLRKLATSAMVTRLTPLRNSMELERLCLGSWTSILKICRRGSLSWYYHSFFWIYSYSHEVQKQMQTSQQFFSMVVPQLIHSTSFSLAIFTKIIRCIIFHHLKTRLCNRFKNDWMKTTFRRIPKLLSPSYIFFKWIACKINGCCLLLLPIRKRSTPSMYA